MSDNIVYLNQDSGRHESWKFPDGTVVAIIVPDNEPPITVKHAVYCLSDVIHRIHESMK